MTTLQPNTDRVNQETSARDGVQAPPGLLVDGVDPVGEYFAALGELRKTWQRIRVTDAEAAAAGFSALDGDPAAAGAWGPPLVKAHIPTHEVNGAYVVEIQGSNVRFRRGWSGEDWQKLPPDRPEVPLEYAASLFDGEDPEEAPEEVGGVRGVVSVFSRASKRRLLRDIMGFPFAQLAHRYAYVFVSLTYPADFPSARASKEHLEEFRERIRRKWRGELLSWWKLEPQRRGAPHYHALACVPRDEAGARSRGFLADLEYDVFGEPVREIPGEVSEFQAWASGAWHEIVASDDYWHTVYGVKVDYVDKVEGIGRYIAKFGRYMSKDAAASDEWHEPGRFWGRMGGSIIKGYLTGEIYVVSKAVWLWLRRTFRRVGIARARSASQRRATKGGSGDWRAGSRSWRRVAGRLDTWNTWDPGGNGREVVPGLMEKLGYEAVLRIDGVRM